MPPSYRRLDHTGDLGLEIHGETREALLQNAAWALTDTLVEAATILPHETRRFEIRADSPEALFVAFLQEWLFECDARGRVFGEFTVCLLGPQHLECTARGEALDRIRHGFKTEVKAVTYHRLKLWRESDGLWWARVILDL